MGAKALINAHPKNVLGSKGARRCRVCGEICIYHNLKSLVVKLSLCSFFQPILPPLSANIIWTCAVNVSGREPSTSDSSRLVDCFCEWVELLIVFLLCFSQYN